MNNLFIVAKQSGVVGVRQIQSPISVEEPKTWPQLQQTKGCVGHLTWEIKKQDIVFPYRNQLWMTKCDKFGHKREPYLRCGGIIL